MNILDKAIAIEGGVNRLAASLEVRQNVVSNWRARGRVPKPWERVLNLEYGAKPDPEPEILQAFAQAQGVAHA